MTLSENSSAGSAENPAGGARSSWRVAAATLIGTSIEWFDFGIYAFAAAVVFPAAFFPELNPAVALLASFTTLAVASLGRPVGAIVFGYIGDRYGRRRALVLSLTLMGAMTFLVGVLPTYATIGVAAPIMLLLIRIMQSLAVGGEWGSALLYAVESAPPRRRALFGSFTQMGSGLGAFLTAGAFALIGLLGDEAVQAWAWRLPFLASAVLIVFGLWIRSQLPETEAFKREVEAQDGATSMPAVTLVRRHWATSLLAVGAFLVPVCGYYIVATFFAGYGAETLKLDTSTVATAGMVAAVVSVVFTPIVALVADRIGVGRVMVVGLALHLVVTVPLFLLLDWGTATGFYLATSVGMFVSTIVYTPVGTLVAGWFPADVRHTGVSLSYQVTGVIGGMVPVVAQSLAIVSGNGWTLVALLFAAMSAISLASVLAKRSAPDLLAGRADSPIPQEV